MKSKEKCIALAYLLFLGTLQSCFGERSIEHGVFAHTLAVGGGPVSPDDGFARRGINSTTQRDAAPGLWWGCGGGLRIERGLVAGVGCVSGLLESGASRLQYITR